MSSSAIGRGAGGRGAQASEARQGMVPAFLTSWISLNMLFGCWMFDVLGCHLVLSLNMLFGWMFDVLGCHLVLSLNMLFHLFVLGCLISS